jgi:hypothetical protein
MTTSYPQTTLKGKRLNLTIEDVGRTLCDSVNDPVSLELVDMSIIILHC